MFERLISWDNLLLAYRKASKGKRGHANVAVFEHHLEDELLALQSELVSRIYRPGRYRSFYIHEPKRRLISAAPFRDRVVHHALCNLIEPLFERSFIFDSYANRIGKGTHRALDKAQLLARQYKYVLLCDIEQFFPSVDHAILLELLSRKIPDLQVRSLCGTILESGAGVLSAEYRMAYFPGDDLFAVNRARGLPIGNLTSQFWANVYMNPFDHFIVREIRIPYLRYVDDFLLFGNRKSELWHAKCQIISRLDRMRLTMHPAAQPRPVTEGISFLGFRIFPERRRLKPRKGLYYRRKLRSLLEKYTDGQIPLESVQASVQGWANHVRYGNTVGLRKAVFGSNRIGRVNDGL